MDSFLSGFSHSYSGTQIGQQGYTGNVNTISNMGTNSSQGVDVTQLQPGDTFQGEIASVNGEDVQILLTNGQYMAARLERDVQVALGQMLNLQVQSNKDNKIVLKPLYDNSSQMMRVGEAALRAANMAVSNKNLALVSNLIQNGMSIDRNTLMTYNRLALQNPQASLSEIVELNKLQIPINESSLNQLQNYQNMEYKLLDGINETADEVLKLYENLSQGVENGEIKNPEAAGKYMAQVIDILSEGDAETQQLTNEREITQTVNAENENPEQNVIKNTTLEANKAADNNSDLYNTDKTGTEKTNIDKPNADLAKNTGSTGLAKDDVKTNIADNDRNYTNAGNINTKAVNAGNADAANTVNAGKNALSDSGADRNVLNELNKSSSAELPDKIVRYINDGKLDMKDIKQLLNDSSIGEKLTTEQKAKVFSSEPFKSMVRNELQNRWTLTPEDLTKEGKVEEFYQKLARETERLSKIMNEALNESGQSGAGMQSKAAANMNENVEFINQMNQMMNYVQLPLKLSNSNAHGDLYVYTNKKNMARKDGMLTAFLHLDMDNLGPLDVSIALQTEKNQVTAKFYLDEDAMALVEEHKEELASRLAKKGYQCKTLLVEKDDDKTVLERIEEQVSGQSAVLSYQTFDTRA